MSEAEKIIALFELCDHMMAEYPKKIEVSRKYIISYLEDQNSLPKELRAALAAPDSRSFLEQAYVDLKQDAQAQFVYLQQMRDMLSASEQNFRSVADAKNLATGWGLSADRSMETVLNQEYTKSDILPPPLIYWQPVNDKFLEYFPFLSDDPRWKNKMDAVARYLNEIRNPWRGDVK